MTTRIGLGFDIHRLVGGDGFRLGGVDVSCAFAVEAHSDGDALYHALVDALMGAAALGDIGDHYPDTDGRWKDADSRVFVESAVKAVADAGFTVGNVDANVFLEAPMLGDLKQDMARNIADLLCIDVAAVSVKAKTFEGLGPIGTGQAVAAQVALILVSTSGATS